MWAHTGRLPHVLSTRCYHDPALHEREVSELFAGGWHPVATRASLGHSGDFVTLDLLDEPVLVRNDGGTIRAFQNVCAHRHSMLTCETRGHAPRLRCQVHGWEYDEEGRSLRIPDAKSFAPLTKHEFCLRRYRAETLGELVFVSLSPTGASLRESLGEEAAAFIERACSRDHALVDVWSHDHAANWKVPVENALESYHVPQVHARPGRTHSKAVDATHVLGDRHTLLVNVTPPAGTLLKNLAALWRAKPEHRYEHLHAFPNLIVATTDLSTLVHVVLPLGPTRSRSVAFCFAHAGEGRNLLHRAVGPILGEVVKRYTWKILDEDYRVLPAIQRGLEASTHEGVIGAREERVHAFQQYVARVHDASVRALP
ncbi:MAG TPA: aromatic ring-hydroxylating dioxygenase subunit alpha [Kofleriaceae bacterium]|jgi:phenylpropionate dioxygenase-like ring-hydroxylating dioxygenase large terminal subunit|nr:aromatic ring-hydroxylating dioxygenase subunit alpha [Kofleriaceae bacterium]